MRMKPLPKFLLIGAIVSAVGYGVNAYVESRPKTEVVEAAAPEPAVKQAPVKAAVREEAPVAAPAQEAPRQTTNAGLQGLLQNGRR